MSNDVLRELKAEKIRRDCSRDLWTYIITTTPRIYNNQDRTRIFKDLADFITEFFERYDILETKDLNNLTEEEKDELINLIRINLATFPRAGKSFFITHMVTWILGNIPEAKIIMVSKSENLTTSFIRNIGNIMRSALYKIIFKDVEVESESATEIGVRRVGSNLKQVRSVYAVGIFGQITGFGANIMILDDIYKSHEDAFSDVINKKIKDIYDSAIETRMEGLNRLEVHIGTRWSNNELFADFERGNLYEKVIKTKAFNEEEQKSNFPTIHDTKKLLRAKKRNKVTFQSIYQQEAIDETIKIFSRSELRLVNNFIASPTKDGYIGNRFVVIDPADGGDFTTAGFFANQRDGRDVLEAVVYEQESINITVDKINMYIIEALPRVVFIETNNDKTLFYKLRDTFINTDIMIFPFKSKLNKHTKIFSKSGDIKERTIFHGKFIDKGKYKKFLEDFLEFHMGTKDHDDAADMLAMKEELTYSKRDFLKQAMNYVYK